MNLFLNINKKQEKKVNKNQEMTIHKTEKYIYSK